jgi:uncharacterized membrane protein YphA (DoxX/SURF4 family)
VSLARVLGALLGAVFVCSGAAKMFNPRWAVQARSFGAPRLVALVIPAIEVFVGAAAVAGVAPRWSVAVLAMLLVVFTAAIVRTLRHGLRPPCVCFGRWSDRPISWRTVARNVVLLGLAAAALVA